MSGFVISRVDPASDRDAENSAGEQRVRRRGPDLTRTAQVEDFRFTHHWLRVGDDAEPGSLVDGDFVCLHDGVLFGGPPGGDPAQHLVDLYRRHGEGFVRHLDGEYAIALYDFARRRLVAATDSFATKPLFLRGAEAASYASALGRSHDGAERLAANTVAVVDLDTGERRDELAEPFDFDHQHKDGYDDWIDAFEQAVRKRAVDGCYVPLSAGYDSGGIDCALGRLDVDFRTYSFEGRENVDLLRRRIDHFQRPGEILPMDAATFDERTRFLAQHCEPASFRVTIFTGDEEDYEVHDDRASRGLAHIHLSARAEGRRVFLSGHSVDETLAACRHWPGSRFPETLRKWPDFDGGWQTAYLAKEEHVAGACGVEGRYPYLDRRLVQEFLWLTAEAKNRWYKAPLHEYMVRCGYPFEPGVKTGFNPLPED